MGLVALLAACGGGGGSAGSSSSGSSTGTGGGTTSATAVGTRITLQVRDKNGVVSQSVAASGGSELVATLTTTAGAPLADRTVTFSDTGNSTLFVFPGAASAKTDGSGVARVKINRTSLTAFGSTSVTARFVGTACEPSCTTAGAGFSSSDSSAFVVRADPPAFRLELRDAANQPTNSISSSGFTTVRASLKFEDGTPVTQKRVDISGDLAKVTFPEGNSQLTDSQGVADIKVARASLTVNGAGTLSVSSSISATDITGAVGSTVVASVLDYQVGQANIGLTRLNLGSGSLPAYGNQPISVVATVNGVATSSPVQVTFNTSCGTVAPATVSTDSSGSAATTFSANLATCAGTTVTLSASAVGAASVSGTVAVAAPVATNVQFVTTTPQLIYLKDSVGTTQAQVVFKVVDSSGNALQNNKLRLTLSNSATGISLDTVGNTAPVDLATDSLGLVSAKVFSGTVPTSVNVRATLLDANNAVTSIFSNSNLLTVASGRPTQSSLSLAATKLSIEALDLDGETTLLTLSMADRQGNPVPPGTQVNFVSESGVLLPAVCVVPPVTPATATSAAIPTSSCSVTLRGQGTRPQNGRVSILAFVAGEEDFTDSNGNNVYDAGEQFVDLGRAYRDDNTKGVKNGTLQGLNVNTSNGQYDTGEFQQPRAGTPECVPGTGCAGDGSWGAADVRQQATIIFATGIAKIRGTVSSVGVRVIVTDANPLNNNSMPTGSIISVIANDNTSTNSRSCAVSGDSSQRILNTLEATVASFGLKECDAGDSVTVRVVTPLGTTTSATVGISAGSTAFTTTTAGGP
jgi:hypothetical protein